MCRLASGALAGKSASASALLDKKPSQAAQSQPPAPKASVTPRRGAMQAPAKSVVKTATARNTTPMEATKAKSWSRLVDKKTLGAHYDYVVGRLGAVRSTQVEEKAQYDATLAKDECAQPGTKTAFTDRSRRLREGHDARQALMPAGARFETLEATTLEDFLHTDEQHPAGQLSQHVCHHKRPLCGKDGAIGQAAGRSVASESFNSQNVISVLDEAATTLEGMPNVGEDKFVVSMGRKIKPAAGERMKHRGDEGDGPVAGDYNKNHTCAEWFQPVTRQAKPMSSRTGMAMVLEARDSDPPVSMHVVAQSKARSAFADGPSEEARRHAMEQNQQVLRFSSTKPQKSSSVVQKPQKSTGGAGVPSGSKRRPDVVAAPRKSNTTTPRSNESSSMARALDLEAADREARTGRAQRQQQEKAFADICKFTTESRRTQLESSRSIRSNFGHMQSSGVASQLVWN